MNRRSPYNLFAKPMLAALAIVVGAVLAASVSGSPVLVAMEPASQEIVVPVLSPVSAVSASQASPLQWGVTESSSIASPTGFARGAVQLARSTPSVPSGGPGQGSSVEESRGCSEDANEVCEPRKNIQEPHQFDDGTWGTRSITCALRAQVDIPIVAAGPGWVVLTFLPSLNIVQVVVCDYGPRCEPDIIVDWF